MAVYIVTWDLNKEKPNYATARATFIEHLNRYSNTKDPRFDSVHFVSTTWSARQVKKDLRTKMDNNDTIIVVKLVKGNYSGWLSEKVWEWIDTRL